MIRKLLPFIITVFTINISFSQTDCSNGMAGDYPCKDYDLMAHLPVSTLANTSGNPEGSDIWGWTDPTTNKEYAIAAMTNSTAFVDVTDPVNPVFLGRLDTSGGTSFWRDVKVYNNHAFIVADNAGNHGMQVFDLTKLRGVTSQQNFTADAVYTGVGSCHNIVINEQSAVAYLVGCKSTNGGGPIFINISDPKNPTKIGDYTTDGYSHDAQVVTYTGPDSDYTNKEIYIGSNENKVVLLDVTDKSNIKKISEINYSQIGYTHQGWFTEDQRYFIVGDETDERDYGMNTRTLIFDFEDLDNPKLSSTYSGASTAIDHNGYVKGNQFFMASYRAGMRVFDISNIGSGDNATSMVETGYFDTYPTSNTTGFNGAWSLYPYFASGNIIINDIERGLFVVRKSGTLSVANFDLKTKFSIAPNPTQNNPTIRAKENVNITSIEVFSLLGKKVFSKNNINKKEFIIPIHNLSKGMYLVKINQKITKKLVVQ